MKNVLFNYHEHDNMFHEVQRMNHENISRDNVTYKKF